jgi:hypothetical protein
MGRSVRSVWKYAISVEDEFQREMPEGAAVIHVAVQRDEPCMWVLVDPSRPPETRTFYVHGTGHPIPAGRAHRGSFLMVGDDFVGHLFEDGPRNMPEAWPDA